MALSNLQNVSPNSFLAGATVTNNRLVKMDSTVNTVIHTAAITDAAVGAALAGAASGELVPVQQFGVAKLTAAAAITVNAEVMPDSGGGGKIAASSGATARSIGIALEAAGADGDIISVQLGVPALKGPANS